MIDPYIPGSPGGEMKCPYCGDNTKDAWQRLVVSYPSSQEDMTYLVSTPEADPNDLVVTQLAAPDQHAVTLDWMYCEADECKQLTIRVHETYWRQIAPATRLTPPTLIEHTETWNARPHLSSPRRFPEGVPEKFRRNYEEAGILLDISPRMSAVLSPPHLGRSVG